MCKQLYNFLQVHKILYEFQFGFRKHHSTILALMEVFIFSFFFFILLCNEQSRQTREINNGEVEQKYCKRIE